MHLRQLMKAALSVPAVLQGWLHLVPAVCTQWYDANGVFKFTGATYNTDAITQNTVFYVETTVGGCTSPRTAVNVTVIETQL